MKKQRYVFHLLSSALVFLLPLSVRVYAKDEPTTGIPMYMLFSEVFINANSPEAPKTSEC